MQVYVDTLERYPGRFQNKVQAVYRYIGLLSHEQASYQHVQASQRCFKTEHNNLHSGVLPVDLSDLHAMFATNAWTYTKPD